MFSSIATHMPNTDKVKAARTGGDVKYAQKMRGMHAASRLQHENAARLDAVHHQLRSFEDAGKGVATGRQYEHEENMRAQKAKREAKAAKSKAFLASLNTDGDVSADQFESPAVLRFGVGDHVQCCVGPDQWSAGRVTQLWYSEPSWPVDRVVPYQVELACGERIFAPADDASLIVADWSSCDHAQEKTEASGRRRDDAAGRSAVSAVSSRGGVLEASFYY